MVDKPNASSPSLLDVLKQCVRPAAQAWEAAERAKVVPPSPPLGLTPAQFQASVAQGRELYLRVARPARVTRRPAGEPSLRPRNLPPRSPLPGAGFVAWPPWQD